ncbi:MAG: single-stranded-DNA-specific exonuclease RecJ [Lachnospiraceae bacterium]|nr:single-stranded-DNA-specific exonuclease RecJ [Candidatus Colinaster equi]
MSKWVVAAKRADFDTIAKELNVDPVLVRIMRNRELLTAEDMRSFIEADKCTLHDPFLLNDMDKAVNIISSKIDLGKRIRIIGDYDVDGITSTYILFNALSRMGALADYAIPNRITDGYGINEHLIDEAVNAGVDTIITCDNGIAAKAVIDKAKMSGITVVITDHHEVPYEENDGKRKYIYPNADAIINPKRDDSTYPYTGICGAMVAYKLIVALSASHPLPQEELDMMRDMAAIGTVCDVMDICDENRVLVKQALANMEEHMNIGIAALRKVCEIDSKPINVYQLGFVIGPCLNATGRLDDANTSIELLSSHDYRDAIVMATKLKQLNDLRKAMTEQGIKDAFEYIENNNLADSKVLVVYLPDLHESLAGIVAGRIREKYYRPCFVLTKGEEGIKGSGRSIEGFHMYNEMVKCGQLFAKYGGHAMAAGLTLVDETPDRFIEAINDNCTMNIEDMFEKITIDVPMPLSYVTEDLIDQLDILEPFGNGNPKPVFAQKNIMVCGVSLMGKEKNMAKIRMRENATDFDGVLFRKVDELKNCIDEKYGEGTWDDLIKSGNRSGKNVLIDIIYYPAVNEFRGRRNIQYVIGDFKC